VIVDADVLNVVADQGTDCDTSGLRLGGQYLVLLFGDPDKDSFGSGLRHFVISPSGVCARWVRLACD